MPLEGSLLLWFLLVPTIMVCRYCSSLYNKAWHLSPAKNSGQCKVVLLCAKQMQNKNTLTDLHVHSIYAFACNIRECVFLYKRVCECVWVDRRAAAYTDGQMSGAGEQQMPEVTPTAAFHWTTGFNTKAGAAPNIKNTCLCLNARGHYIFFSPVIDFLKLILKKKKNVESFEITCWMRTQPIKRVF